MAKYKKAERAESEVFDIEEVEVEAVKPVAPVAKQDKFDSFNFDTPKNVVKKMLTMVDIQPNDIIMEPCAGRGSILEEFPSNNPYLAVEQDANNCRILKSHGFSVENMDFTTYKGRKANVIFMTPPIVKGDLALISHAWETLVDGGAMVALYESSLENSFPEWLLLNSKTHSVTDKYFSDNNLKMKILVARRG